MYVCIYIYIYIFFLYYVRIHKGTLHEAGQGRHRAEPLPKRGSERAPKSR